MHMRGEIQIPTPRFLLETVELPSLEVSDEIWLNYENEP